MTTINETTTTDAPAEVTPMLAVTTVAPAKVADNEQVIAWSRRSTAANPVANENRYRGVTIHRSTLAIPDGCTTSKFSKLLQDTIDGLATARFTDYIKDRMQDKEIPAAILSLDNVLAYWAEEKQRSVINGEAVLNWLKSSATLAAMDANKQKTWTTKVPKIAAPSYINIFSKGEAAAIIAKIAEADADHAIAQFIATRCNAIINNESIEDAF